MMKKAQSKGVALLLLTSMIWGLAFVAQSKGMDKVGPLTFSSSRTLLGALVLLPAVLWQNKREPVRDRAKARRTLRVGLLLGLVFCAANNAQQFAFRYSTAGKIAFITALYMFFVPLLGLLLRQKPPALTWVCAAFGFAGLYLLSVGPDGLGAVNRGDWLALLCSLLFAVHILLVDRLAGDLDGIRLACLQFAAAGLLTGVLTLLFETPRWSELRAAALPILYAGAMSCGLAYTLQILGQRYVSAPVASLLLCTESVFAVLAAALLLHERMSGREIAGCAVMFAAILLSQLPSLRESIKTQKMSGSGLDRESRIC